MVDFYITFNISMMWANFPTSAEADESPLSGVISGRLHPHGAESDWQLTKKWEVGGQLIECLRAANTFRKRWRFWSIIQEPEPAGKCQQLCTCSDGARTNTFCRSVRLQLCGVFRPRRGETVTALSKENSKIKQKKRFTDFGFYVWTVSNDPASQTSFQITIRT